MQHFKLFAKSLQLSTLDTCCFLILLLQRIPYIFRRIFLQDGFQYRSINGLEHIVLGLEIFQFLIFIRLLLYLTKIQSFCCSSDPCLYQVPISLGTQKILYQHTPMVIVTIKPWNGRLHEAILKCHVSDSSL